MSQMLPQEEVVAPVSVPTPATKSPSQRAWSRFRKNRGAMLAMVVLLLIHVCALFAPTLAPYPPTQINLMKRLNPPSSEHLLGTDENGRDVLSRLLYGARISLAVGLAAVVFSVTLGTMIGALAGFLGGYVESILMRLTDGMLSIPVFFFMLTTLALFGASMTNIVLAIGLTSWMQVARVVRSEVLRTREMVYVEAASALGASPMRILTKHILPQAAPSIIVSATLGVAYAILMESSLSFLGLGIQPPDASWGNMLSKARGYLWNAPFLAFIPGMTIFVTVLLYNWLGDGLRDALDPASSK
jgi:peptide/nickel transport system permease protein